MPVIQEFVTLFICYIIFYPQKEISYFFMYFYIICEQNSS